jgi:transcriptional regulator with XRE-family HTH domain
MYAGEYAREGYGGITPMWFKEMGKKIQKAREEMGMTQMDLARAMGITQAALSNYELGKRRLYLHQIEDIARLLSKNLDYFIPSPGGTPGPGPDLTRSRQKIISRINEMNKSELDLLSAYLDFLDWRKNHG